MVYPISRYTWFPVMRFFIKKTIGLENLPKSGPYIIACKHLASLDGVFLGAKIIPIINSKIHFVANVARWGWFWEKIVAEKWHGCIQYYKENPKMCLDIAIDFLKKGEIVGIFPEGVLQDRGDNQYKAKTGTARMAILAQVPIVPVGLIHDISVRSDLSVLAQRLQAIKNIFLNPHSLEIHIGQPFEIKEYYDKEVKKEMLIEATNKIMNRIEELTNINYKN
jgi:1-acyl-sn-glycerol-3-phosphate acyltransferase